MKKAIALFLMAAMCLALFSCNQGKDITTDSTTGEVTTQDGGAVIEDDRANAKDSLPDSLNYNGETITIFSRSDSPWYEEIFAEEQIGEVVNDAVYNRNRSVEDRLNVKINVIAEPGIHGNEASFNGKIKNSILAEDHAFDLISGYAFFITPLGTEGLFLNLNHVNNMDFSKPWWSQSLASELEIDGKLFFMAGDLSLTMIKSLFMVYFNKRLATEWDVGDLYDVVLKGEWTIDKMTEITKNVHKDVNGDSVYDQNDILGLGLTTGNYIDALYAAFDQPVTMKNTDGLPELTLNTPKMADMVAKTYSFLYENQGVIARPETAEDDKIIKGMFSGGQLLFMTGTLNLTEQFRDMADGYGIIPYPKWNAEQDGYHTAAQDAYSLFCIPKSVENPDMVGAFAEAMAAESYRTVTPAFYDVALKGKYIRDDASSQMLDIIRDGVMFNFGFVNSSSIEWISHIYRSLMTEKKTDFVSLYESKESLYKKKLEQIISAYEALD
ncbi:MAG: hypothetical protein AB9835_02740 [Eubacteriales bacterium]